MPIRKSGKKKLLILGVIIIIVAALGSGALAAISSHRANSIPQMTFEDMLVYTTQDNADALITVGIIQNGETSIAVYGENAAVLPNGENQGLEYEIGSVTKTFTSSLLCQAIDQGKVELSDSIDKYIELPAKKHYPTLQQLVTHSSGYKSYYFEWQMAWNFLSGQDNSFYGISTQALKDKIAEISLTDKDYPFVYSNFGIAVVGSVLEEVYGNDYRTIMNAFIKSELELENTRISDGTGNLSGYWNWNPNDAYLPSGALISTIGDMMKYLELHMTDDPSYLALGHERIAKINATTERSETRNIRMDSAGIGWMIDDQHGIIWHNGATSNFNSYLAFDKERQIGVIILSNLSPDYRIPATVMGAKLMTTLQAENLQ